MRRPPPQRETPERDLHPALRPFADHAIYWTLAVALAVRLAVAFICWSGVDAFQGPLTPRYLTLSQSLTQHLEFSEDPIGGKPSVSLSPLYPALLSLERLLFGSQMRAIVLAQALAGTLACGLLFALAYTLLGRTAAIMTALALALDPAVAVSSLLLSHEGLYLLLLLAAMWALVLAFVHDYSWAWFLGGAAAALAALTWHEALWAWAPAALGVALCRSARASGYLRRLGLFLTAFALVVSPWFARNYLITGELVWATHADLRWQDSRHAGVIMAAQGSQQRAATGFVRSQLAEQVDPATLSEVELARLRRQRAIGAIGEHPLAALRFWARAAMRALTEPETEVAQVVIDISFPQRRVNHALMAGYRWAVWAFQWLVIGIVLIGAVQHRSYRARFVWWAPVFYLGFFLPTLADIEAGASLRYVVAPALYLLAAREILCYWPWVARRLHGSHERYGKVVYSGPVVDSGEEPGGGVL